MSLGKGRHDRHGNGRREHDGEDGKGVSFTVRDRRFWAADQGAEPGGTPPPGVEEETPKYPTYVEQLRAEADEARRQAAEKDEQLREYIAAYKEQVVHGLEEVKQRLERDNQKQLELQRGQLVSALLEVLDNLQRSIAAAESSHSVDALLEGVRLVASQFQSKLGALGLEPIATVGQPFDPAVHDAVAVVPVTDPAQAGRIMAEIQPGYRFGERVLRPARVAVGKLAS